VGLKPQAFSCLLVALHCIVSHC